MAVEARDVALAAGALAAGGGLVYLATRRPSPPAEDLAIAVTGPTPETARELIRANVELAGIEARRQVDLAGLFTSGLVELERVEMQREVALKGLEVSREIEFERSRSQVQIAQSFADVAKYQAQAQLQAAQAQAAAQQQKSFFDFLGGIIGTLFGGLFG